MLEHATADKVDICTRFGSLLLENSVEIFICTLNSSGLLSSKFIREICNREVDIGDVRFDRLEENLEFLSTSGILTVLLCQIGVATYFKQSLESRGEFWIVGIMFAVAAFALAVLLIKGPDIFRRNLQGDSESKQKGILRWCLGILFRYQNAPFFALAAKMTLDWMGSK